MSDPIERYLDELLLELSARPCEARRVLAEAEEHLQDSVAAGLAEGLALAQAQHRALERFGAARTVAEPFRPAQPAWVLARRLVPTLLRIGAIGLIAVGLSGALAAALGAAFGHDFVAADPAGVAYTPARCAEYLALQPHARDCHQAALSHHYGEIVDYRLAAGIAGALLLAGLRRRRRRSRRSASDLRQVPPLGFAAAVGASLFGVAALGLLVQGLGQLVSGTSGGPGAMLSGGIVAAAAACAFALSLQRQFSRAAPGHQAREQR